MLDHTETQTSPEKLIASNQANNTVAYYNDTNWLNTWNVSYGGKTIKVDNVTKVVNGNGSNRQNYYVTKNKSSNNNAGFRVVKKAKFNGEYYLTTAEERSTFDGYGSSYRPTYDMNTFYCCPGSYNNYKNSDTWYYNYNGFNVNCRNIIKINNGRGYNGMNYYVSSGTTAWDYQRGYEWDWGRAKYRFWYTAARRSYIYEGIYVAQYDKYNKGKRSCDIYEGRYERRDYITFNKNINTFKQRYDNILIDFSNEVDEDY